MFEVDGQTSQGFEKQWLYIRQYKYIGNSIIPKHKSKSTWKIILRNENITRLEVQHNPSNIHNLIFNLTAHWEYFSYIPEYEWEYSSKKG